MRTVLFIIIAIIAMSCATSSPECLNKRHNDLIIRWGQESEKMDFTLGYEINTNRELFILQRSKGEKEYLREKITTIKPDAYCRNYNAIMKNILKTGSLHVPSDPAMFLEFTSKSSGIQFRAVWNPKHRNAGNKEFHKLFDSLMTLVPEKKRSEY